MNPPRRHPPRAARRVSRKGFPSLADFFSGYLHEDVLSEHGSAEAAAAAFAADASSAERRQVLVELQLLLARSEEWSIDDLQRAVADLGAAWKPSSRAELQALVAGWEEGG